MGQKWVEEKRYRGKRRLLRVEVAAVIAAVRRKGSESGVIDVAAVVVAVQQRRVVVPALQWREEDKQRHHRLRSRRPLQRDRPGNKECKEQDTGRGDKKRDQQS